MMTRNQKLYQLRGITQEEFSYLLTLVDGMSDEQFQEFLAFYNGRRQSPTDILLYTLLGFIVVAGVQRFVVGQIGMGFLYLITGGFCLIGTIVDVINHRSIALDFNKKTAFECAQLIRVGK